MMLLDLPFDGFFKEENGHKFWKPTEYKGYYIQPYESPTGKRVFLVGDPKTHEWLYDGLRVEDCACFIDMLVAKAGFKKVRSRKNAKKKTTGVDPDVKVLQRSSKKKPKKVS